MSQLIKVKFLKNNMPSGNAYTYFSNELVKPGDLVQINLQMKGVVVDNNVSEEEIKDFRDKVKFIHGKIIEAPEPKTIEEENGGNE
jgi:hypothetical protein